MNQFTAETQCTQRKRREIIPVRIQHMHSEIPSQELITETLANAAQSSTRRGPRILGRLRFWWSWFVAGALLLILAPPILVVARLANKPDWVYPWADFGARTWLRLSGVNVDVKG